MDAALTALASEWVVHIPVLPRMTAVLDATPKDRLLMLTNANGQPLTEHRASEGVRQGCDRSKLSDPLRLQDARGTAATRLLNAVLNQPRTNRVLHGLGTTPPAERHRAACPPCACPI